MVQSRESEACGPWLVACGDRRGLVACSLWLVEEAVRDGSASSLAFPRATGHMLQATCLVAWSWCILNTPRRCTMTRLSADIDPRILEEAQRVSGCKTKREAIDRALREFVARRRGQELAGLEGKDLVAMSIEELLQWRSESMASKS